MAPWSRVIFCSAVGRRRRTGSGRGCFSPAAIGTAKRPRPRPGGRRRSGRRQGLTTSCSTTIAAPDDPGQGVRDAVQAGLAQADRAELAVDAEGALEQVVAQLQLVVHLRVPDRRGDLGGDGREQRDVLGAEVGAAAVGRVERADHVGAAQHRRAHHRDHALGDHRVVDDLRGAGGVLGVVLDHDRLGSRAGRRRRGRRPSSPPCRRSRRRGRPSSRPRGRWRRARPAAPPRRGRPAAAARSAARPGERTCSRSISSAWTAWPISSSASKASAGMRGGLAGGRRRGVVGMSGGACIEGSARAICGRLGHPSGTGASALALGPVAASVGRALRGHRLRGPEEGGVDRQASTLLTPGTFSARFSAASVIEAIRMQEGEVGQMLTVTLRLLVDLERRGPGPCRRC